MFGFLFRGFCRLGRTIRWRRGAFNSRIHDGDADDVDMLIDEIPGLGRAILPALALAAVLGGGEVW
ncbi:MAG: hypothetical protein LBP75_03195 [Planctomycetota bacterium]|nr:hypothetical protein [Planctomycetota bacterium]